MNKDKLPEIPSEFIEPYLKAMLCQELEHLSYYPTQKQLDEAIQNLKGVERFVSRYCGLHAKMATSNVYYNFYKLTLDQVKEIVK